MNEFREQPSRVGCASPLDPVRRRLTPPGPALHGQAGLRSQDELGRLIRMRPPGTTPAAAIREFVLDSVEGIRRTPAEQWRGELGYLAAISPTVHRLMLEMLDRQAAAFATASSSAAAAEVSANS